MVSQSKPKSVKPLDQLNPNGLTYKIGLLVLFHVEEEPKPCTENAFWEAPRKPLLAREKLSWLGLVTSSPVLLLEMKKMRLRKLYPWKLEWKECLTDLKDMKPVSLKREIWKSWDKTLGISLDLLESPLELFWIIWHSLSSKILTLIPLYFQLNLLILNSNPILMMKDALSLFLEPLDKKSFFVL